MDEGQDKSIFAPFRVTRKVTCSIPSAVWKSDAKLFLVPIRFYWFLLNVKNPFAQAIGSSHGSDLDATNACGFVWWLQVRGSKWLGCHAGRQEVGRCRTRGESEEKCAGKKACKRVHPGFETQGRRHQKSETGVPVAPQKGHVSSKIKKKKKKKESIWAHLHVGINRAAMTLATLLSLNTMMSLPNGLQPHSGMTPWLSVREVSLAPLQHWRWRSM